MTSTPTLPHEGLSVDASGRRVPTAWERARRRVDLEDPVVGWAASVGLMLLSLFLRLWKLGTPKVFEFDETYYAKDAWSLLHFGYARGYVDGANEKILDGKTTGQWTDGPSMIVHPEAGKWLIALGEKAFGMDPFGWRVAAAVVGSLMVLVMCRLARRMTGSTALGLVAGLLLSLDGLQFVLSRLALLDIFLAFFILCAVSCLVADRDWYRAKMARLVPDQIADPASYGPVRGLLFRPWLLASGICWGLAIGTKWTAIYPLAAFGDHGLAVGRRGAAVVRRALGDAALDRHRRASRRSSTSSSSAGSSTPRRGPAGWCTPTSTRSRCRPRSTPSSSRNSPAPSTRTASRRRTTSTTAASAGRRRASPTPTASVRSSSHCGRCTTTTATSTRSTRTS